LPPVRKTVFDLRELTLRASGLAAQPTALLGEFLLSLGLFEQVGKLRLALGQHTGKPLPGVPIKAIGARTRPSSNHRRPRDVRQEGCQRIATFGRATRLDEPCEPFAVVDFVWPSTLGQQLDRTSP
jgi:hypothetical protein